MRLYAPRILYERTDCRSSRFRNTFAPVRAERASLYCNGVLTATPFRKPRASSILAAVTTPAVAFVILFPSFSKNIPVSRKPLVGALWLRDLVEPSNARDPLPQG